MSDIVKDLSQKELFSKVSEICSAVNSVVSTQELLEISLHQTLKLFQARRGSIFIRSETSKKLTLKVSQGLEKEEKSRLTKSMGQGIVGKVAQMKKPIYVEDISRDDRFENFQARTSYSSPSFLCAPLMVKDKLIGVISLADKIWGEKFRENELQLIDFLTSQIALNYRRIQLYKKFKNVLKESKSLKTKLGKSDQEAAYLKRQIHIQEKLATIGKLAGGIAHEFNNPLDGVIRYTNLCLEHSREDEVIRGYLLEIKQGLKRMANIVKNLLACSRAEVPEHQQRINFDDALKHALDNLKADITLRQAKIVKKIDGRIPLMLDLGLERILSNLINNAIDAVGEEGVVEIAASAKNGSLKMQIKDNGKGIHGGDLEQVFEPFFTTKDIEKGCGLGLTIVGEIIKSYNGTIHVESQPGKGTTFLVELPLN